MALISCGDNENYSTLHNLTDEELAELARQDSIKAAQLSAINAGLVLEYDITFNSSSSSYDGTTLEVPMQEIADYFGISSVATLCEMICEYEITPFAIEGSSHADNMTSSTSSSYWGHWWTKDGDVTSWGTNSYVFTEFWNDSYFDDYEGSYFFECGQYPGLLAEGDEITVIEALKYEDLRVAIVINFHISAKEAVSGAVANTQYLSCEIAQHESSYDTVPVEFDLDQVLSDLGISSMDEVEWIAVNSDGSYAQEPNAGNEGYWFELDGYAGSWGSNASVYTSYEGDNIIGIGQMPGVVSSGEVYVIQYGCTANSKIEMFEITVTITDPVTVSGEIVGSQTVSVSFAADFDWTYEESPCLFDVQAMYDALGVSSPDEVYVFGTNEDGSWGTPYSCYSAIWHNADGYLCDWGTEGCSLYSLWPGDFWDDDADDWLEWGDEYIGIGQYSDNIEVGGEYKIYLNFSANDKIYSLTINVTLTE